MKMETSVVPYTLVFIRFSVRTSYINKNLPNSYSKQMFSLFTWSPKSFRAKAKFMLNLSAGLLIDCTYWHNVQVSRQLIRVLNVYWNLFSKTVCNWHPFNSLKVPTLFCTSQNFPPKIYYAGRRVDQRRLPHFFCCYSSAFGNLMKVTIIRWKPLGKLTFQGLKGKCVVSISLKLAPFSNEHWQRPKPIPPS